MDNNRKRTSITWAATLALSLISIEASATLQYSFMDLGTLGGAYSQGNGINDLGQVTGYSIMGNNATHAFITGINGNGMTDIGTLGGAYSQGNGINNAGQVTGYSYTGTGATHGFITGANGNSIADISPSSAYSMGTSINNKGQVAGYAYQTASTPYHSAFITGNNGTNFAYLPENNGAFAFGKEANSINASGQLTGVAYTTNADTLLPLHTFITDANGNNINSIAGKNNLGDLGGVSSCYDSNCQYGYYNSYSQGNGINSSGQITGYSSTNTANVNHAFSTGVNGTDMIDLGTLGGIDSAGKGINNAGHVVGHSLTAAGVSHGFLYIDGTMHDLNNLIDASGNGWVINEATAINNNQQITGYAYNATLGRTDAFLLTVSAAPEPETYAMMLMGLGCVGVVSRRKSKKLSLVA